MAPDALLQYVRARAASCMARSLDAAHVARLVAAGADPYHHCQNGAHAILATMDVVIDATPLACALAWGLDDASVRALARVMPPPARVTPGEWGLAVATGRLPLLAALVGRAPSGAEQPLLHAALRSDLRAPSVALAPTVRVLLLLGGQDPNERDGEGRTPLYALWHATASTPGRVASSMAFLIGEDDAAEVARLLTAAGGVFDGPIEAELRALALIDMEEEDEEEEFGGGNQKTQQRLWPMLDAPAASL